MKKYFLLLPCFALSATLAQSQTQSGTTGQPGAQPGTLPGQQQPGVSGQIGTRPGVPQTGATGVITNDPAGASRVGGIIPGGDTNRIPFGGTNTGQFINDPTGTNTSGGVPFGSTNQVRFGSTNPVQFGATNRADGLPTGNTPFAGSGAIQDPSGAAAAQTNQVGVVLRDGAAADAAFAQQLNAALARGGATRIFFPQTRSTVTLVNQNGSILLTGNVSSEQEKQEIELRVKNSAGVQAVENQLQIAGQNGAISPGQNPAPGTETDRQLLNP